MDPTKLAETLQRVQMNTRSIIDHFSRCEASDDPDVSRAATRALQALLHLQTVLTTKLQAAIDEGIH